MDPAAVNEVEVFLKKLQSNQEQIDYDLDRRLDSQKPKYEKFSEVFSELYEIPPEFHFNRLSWLAEIVNNFSLPDGIRQDELNAAIELEQIIGIGKQTHGIRNFFRWLYTMYLQMAVHYWNKKHCPSKDRIFGFMRGFRFSETRVVIVGQDPIKRTPEQEAVCQGYAFHNVVCPVSQKLLEIVVNEHSLLSAQMGGTEFSMFNLTDATQSCSMQGWINQKVLLINWSLSLKKIFEHKDYRNFLDWGKFVGHLLGRISEAADHAVVFILLGAEANKGSPYITSNDRHLVINTNHPGFYLRENNSPNEEFDWRAKLPFVNTNLFFHQHGQPLIDWMCVGEVDLAQQEKRHIQMTAYFHGVIQRWPNVGDAGQQVPEPAELCLTLVTGARYQMQHNTSPCLRLVSSGVGNAKLMRAWENCGKHLSDKLVSCGQAHEKFDSTVGYREGECRVSGKGEEEGEDGRRGKKERKKREERGKEGKKKGREGKKRRGEGKRRKEILLRLKS